MAGVFGMRKRPLGEILARNPAGEKRCAKCRLWLPEDEYLSEPRLSDGIRSQCKACDRFSRYGLTRTDALSRLDEQGWSCPICDKEFRSFKDFVVDHDHSCCHIYGGRKRCGNCTRGFICTNCNVKVLAVLENPELIARANNYLKKYA